MYNVKIRLLTTTHDRRVPPVQASDMAKSPIGLIFWSLVDTDKKLLCSDKDRHPDDKFGFDSNFGH